MKVAKSMGKMILRAGDNVVAYFFPREAPPWYEYLTVRGFSCVGAHFEERGWLHWYTERNWYGCGYYTDIHLIYVKYAWLIPYTCVFEKVRLERFSDITFSHRNRIWKRRDITDLMVLKAYEKYMATEFRGKFAYDFIVEVTGAPFKVVWRAIERANDRGYLDYGTSLRTAWITDKGKQFISSQ